MEKHLNYIFNIKFLGCKVNSYEVECIANTLESYGLKFFDENINKNSDCDVVILNTCAVTSVSSKKSRNMIRRLKRIYPNALIAVMGCYASLKYDELLNEDIDILIGTQNRDKLANLILEKLQNRDDKVQIKDSPLMKEYEPLNLDHFLTNTRAYVKIQDGCNNFCSYCIIPFVRGRSRSRKKEEVIEEIQNLVKNGYKEVILTGIDISSYGFDLYESYNFSDLLEDILTNVKDLYRIRISSIEESNIDSKFLELLKKYDNIASHLHIPLQSGSKDILLAMRRKYNIKEFIEKVDIIRSIRPDISFTTDIIVGFPGESEENFNETYEVAKRIGFNKIHAFPFSPREGTLAYKMENQIDPKIKDERVKKLLELSDELSEEYNSRFNGEKMEFLMESDKEGVFIGHSSNFLEIKIESKEDLNGKIIEYIYKN